MNQENIFDGGYSFMSTPCSISYLFTNKSVRTYGLHIFSLSIYPMKLHEFFFFLQALAWIFFLDLTPPLPGYLMVHPLLIHRRRRNNKYLHPFSKLRDQTKNSLSECHFVRFI